MSNIGGIDLTGATIAAFGALLVYDVFFVTFAEEVALVWPSRWNLGKLLFFLNRYLPFVDTFLSLHLLLGKSTDRGCLLGFRAVTWLIVVGIIISEIILMIRTYALWGQNRIILIILSMLASGVFIPAIVVTQLEVDSFAYKALPVGCSKTKKSSPIIFVGFLLLIIFETTILALTLIRARQHHLSRETRSPLIRQMYKDGLFYYLYVFTFSIVNLLIAVAAPPQFANWLTTPQRVFHSILCTRVLLHIRSHSEVPESWVITTQGSLSFAPQEEQGHTTFSYSSGSGTVSGSGSGSGSGPGSSASRTLLTFSSRGHGQSYSQQSGGDQFKSPELVPEAVDPEYERDTEAIELQHLSHRTSHVRFDSLGSTVDEDPMNRVIEPQAREKGKGRV